MIQIRPGDMLSIEHDGIFFYAFIVTKIKLFGGNLLYGLYRHTQNPIGLEEILSGDLAGFFSIVDLIQFKRSGSIKKIGRDVSIPHVIEPMQYKQTFRKQDSNGYLVRLFDNAGEYLGQYDADKKSALPKEVLQLPEYSTDSGEFFVINIRRKWHQSKIVALYLGE